MAGVIGTRLRREREIWDSKPSLRAVYSDFFERIGRRLLPGPTLEIGSGTGRFAHDAGAFVTLDIQAAPWIDVVADAHSLPFGPGTFRNIVLLDTLHHLERPLVFLEEARRVLQSGGRLILLEPGITPLSGMLYRWFHDEPVRMGDDVFGRESSGLQRDPYDANQAIPTLLFDRYRERFESEITGLRVVELTRLSLLAYPLCGGFQNWSLIPQAAVRPLLAIEDRMLPWIGRWAAMRILVVLKRT